MKDKKVRDVMTRGVISVNLEDSVREVVTTLNQNRIHAVAVTTSGCEVMGVISEIDVIGHIDEDIDKLRAEDIMSSHIRSVNPQTSLVEAAKVMRERHYHRLLVMGESPRHQVAVGILSITDIVAEMAKEK